MGDCNICVNSQACHLNRKAKEMFNKSYTELSCHDSYSVVKELRKTVPYPEQLSAGFEKRQ